MLNRSSNEAKGSFEPQLRDWVIERSGLRPIRFHGKMRAVTGTKRNEHPPGANRWYEITLFATDGSPAHYVAAVSYITEGKREQNYHWAFASPRPAEVAEWLEGLDPIPPFPIGYIPGTPNHVKYQADLENNLAWQYSNGVSDVLSALPEFAERIV